MYNKEKQWKISFENINIFGYLGEGGTFNNQTGSILVHIYSLFNNNVHVKYRSNLIRFFFEFNCFGDMLGPYIKSRGTTTRGTEMSANAHLITVETYVQKGETI